MRITRPAALAAVAFVAALSVGVAAPAQAAEPTGFNPYMPGGGTVADLNNYLLDVRGAALYDAQPDAAKAAWSKQYANVAAKEAGLYRAGLTYGNVDAEHLAEVVPIAGDQFVKPRTPLTSLKSFTKVTPTSAGVATIAIAAYSQRADIADTVTSWVGIDANSNVCADPTAGSGFINFLSGQDCAVFKQSIAMVAQQNKDASGGLTTENLCEVADPTACFQFVGVGTPYFSSASWCFKMTGTPADGGNFRISSGDTGPFSTRAYYWSYYNLCGAYPTANGLALISPSADPATTTYWFTANPGIVSHTTSSPADPPRVITCVYTFTDATTATGVTPSFRESAGAFPAPICPAIPAAKTLRHIHITEDGGGVSNVLQDQDTTASYQAHNAADTAACTTHGCILDLKDLRSGKSCFAEQAACDGWFQSSTRDADYSCEYGGQATTVSDCYVYAQVFNLAKRQAGDPYADPHTGEDTGGSTGYSEDQLNLERPAQGPDSDLNGRFRDCFGGTYSAFNPLEWVVKPIQCGLEWAFVPSSSSMLAAAEAVRHDWDGTAIGQLATVAPAWRFSPSSTGCKRTVNYPTTGGQTVAVDVWNFCDGAPMAQLMPESRLLIDAVLAVGCFFAVRRSIAATVDFKG